MLPTPTESHTREPARRPVSPRAPPTPRAQLSRVVVAAGVAVLLGAGPAVAWDLSTQPPRAEARSSWPRPSPWLSAGKQMKAAVGGIARVYLPRDTAAPADSSDPTGAPSAPSPTAPPTAATTAPVVISVPIAYPYRIPRR
jgi:hypothetical protein